MLIEFDREKDAEEFAEAAGQSNYFENGDFSPYNLRSVMLLAGEGDKEDNKTNVDVDEPAGEPADVFL